MKKNHSVTGSSVKNVKPIRPVNMKLSKISKKSGPSGQATKTKTGTKTGTKIGNASGKIDNNKNNKNSSVSPSVDRDIAYSFLELDNGRVALCLQGLDVPSLSEYQFQLDRPESQHDASFFLVSHVDKSRLACANPPLDVLTKIKDDTHLLAYVLDDDNSIADLATQGQALDEDPAEFEHHAPARAGFKEVGFLVRVQD